jgi:ABC-type multidrug transport system ATPase subunit
MLIIDKGRKVAEGPVSELFNPAETVVELRTLDDAEAYSILKTSSLSSYLLDKKSDSILLKMHRDQIPQAIREIVAMNVKVLSFHSRHSLEDYFLSLTSDNQHVEAFTN